MKHLKPFELFEGRGPQGYFPPMGADTPAQKNDTSEEIYKTGVAIKVATELKKAIDKLNPADLSKGMIAPFVNYYPSTNRGNLILGFVFTGKDTDELYKHKEELEKILKIGKTQIWHDFHKGMNGKYKGVDFKSGIAYSIITPGRQFSEDFAKKLKAIFEK